jgi:hypothetical protein
MSCRMRARARPQRRTLVALLDLYNVRDPLRTDLIEIARTADGQRFTADEWKAFLAGVQSDGSDLRPREATLLPSQRVALLLPSGTQAVTSIGSASVLIMMSSLTSRTPVRYVRACSAAVRSLP